MSKSFERKYWTLPDAGERSPNDPMYLVSSDALVRILNMEQTFEKPLKKRDITDEILAPLIAVAAERGWKAVVTNGKQLLLSIEEIQDVTPAVNPHHNFGTFRSHGRRTIFVTFDQPFSLINILGVEFATANCCIGNPRLEGVMMEDPSLTPTLGQRFVETAQHVCSQFLRSHDGNQRELHLNCRVPDTMVPHVIGTINVETGTIKLHLNNFQSNYNYTGALISFDLMEGA